MGGRPAQPMAFRLIAGSVRDGECLRWTRSKNFAGYGHIKIKGRNAGVHRVAYETWVAPIPDGLEIDHLCKVRDCIEPTHLEAVTHAENLRRVDRGFGAKADDLRSRGWVDDAHGVPAPPRPESLADVLDDANLPDELRARIEKAAER